MIAGTADTPVCGGRVTAHGMATKRAIADRAALESVSRAWNVCPRRCWSRRAGCNPVRGQPCHPCSRGRIRSVLSAVPAPVAQRPKWLAPPARTPHALVADAPRPRPRPFGVGSVSASQNLRGRASGEPAVQKLDSPGNPGDSSGCQNLAPRRFPLRPHRIWEAGDFRVIPGESRSIKHVLVHRPGSLFASLRRSGQPRVKSIEAAAGGRPRKRSPVQVRISSSMAAMCAARRHLLSSCRLSPCRKCHVSGMIS